MTEATPWSEMLAAAMRAGVAPAAFWRLSVKEWRVLATGPREASPLTRARFDLLAARFPDANT